MYKTILMAFDGSAEGRHALSEGAELAAACGAKVHLLAVIPLPAALGFAEASDPEAVFQRDLAEVDATLEAGVGELRRRGLTVEGHRRAGEPVVEIVALAEELAVDLIVLGHRRRSRLERWWQGSLGSSLLDRSRASILVAIGEE